MEEASTLADVLRRLGERDPFLSYDLGDDQDGWTRVDRLLPDGGAAVSAVLRGIETGESVADTRVQAAWFVHRYAWALAAPAVACYSSARIVPDLRPENTAFAGGPEIGIRLLDTRRSAPVARDDELTARLRAGLEAHLDHILSLEPLRRLGRRSRWLLAADACAAAWLDVCREFSGRAFAIRETERFLSAPGPLAVPLQLLDLDPSSGADAEIARRRSSCCLAYRVPGLEKCSVCPLLRESRSRPG